MNQATEASNTAAQLEVLAADLRKLVVQSHHELPEWHRSLDEKLDTTVAFAVEGARFRDVVTSLASITGVNIVVAPGIYEDFGYGGPVFTLEFGHVKLREVLDTFCAAAGGDLATCLAGEAIYIGYRGELPETYITRVYNISPLVEGIDGDEDEREEWIEHLQDVVVNCVEQDSWDMGATITSWNDLLVVSQTESAHDKIDTFLNRLLNRGRRATVGMDSWRDQLDAKLDEKTSVHFDAVSLNEAAQFLRISQDLPIFVDPDYADETITLELADVRVRTVLEWLAAQSNLSVLRSAGTVMLSDHGADTTIEMYPIADLMAYMEDEEDPEEGLYSVWELLQESVAMDSWDMWGSITSWRDMLVITQTPEVHDEIRGFLTDLRQAIR